jgi:tripeptide aminopeptidase
VPVPLRAGSTDANVGMDLRIPSITVTSGGAGKGAHSLGEEFDTTDSWKGTVRAVLLAIALAR